MFEGVFSHAGKIRDVDLTKREWVLNGDTVNYTPSFMVKESLSYDLLYAVVYGERVSGV